MLNPATKQHLYDRLNGFIRALATVIELVLAVAIAVGVHKFFELAARWMGVEGSTATVLSATAAAIVVVSSVVAAVQHALSAIASVFSDAGASEHASATEDKAESD